MFLENTKKSGSIEVICGSMFSGKTEELIRRLKRAQFAKQKIATFKPTIATEKNVKTLAYRRLFSYLCNHNARHFATPRSL